jgi:hypothetical protein
VTGVLVFCYVVLDSHRFRVVRSAATRALRFAPNSAREEIVVHSPRRTPHLDKRDRRAAVRVHDDEACRSEQGGQRRNEPRERRRTPHVSTGMCHRFTFLQPAATAIKPTVHTFWFVGQLKKFEAKPVKGNKAS